MLDSKEHILDISSEISEIEKVREFVERFIEEFNCPPECHNRILLCTTEGVINAIEHGNSRDKNKKVFIFASAKGRSLRITIKDQGCGFDMSEVPDPTNKENIKKENGRGLHIIKNIIISCGYRNLF